MKNRKINACYLKKIFEFSRLTSSFLTATSFAIERSYKSKSSWDDFLKFQRSWTDSNEVGQMDRFQCNWTDSNVVGKIRFQRSWTDSYAVGQIGQESF